MNFCGDCKQFSDKIGTCDKTGAFCHANNVACNEFDYKELTIDRILDILNRINEKIYGKG